MVGGSVREGGEGKKLGVLLVRPLASLPHICNELGWIVRRERATSWLVERLAWTMRASVAAL